MLTNGSGCTEVVLVTISERTAFHTHYTVHKPDTVTVTVLVLSKCRFGSSSVGYADFIGLILVAALILVSGKYQPLVT